MRGLTFAAKTGEVHALLGHNGAGKSTAMNAIVSIVSPTAGDVIVFGESAVSFPDRARARIGLCPQFGAFFFFFFFFFLFFFERSLFVVGGRLVLLP